MGTRIKIDLNVRVRGTGTYAGLEDVDGPIAVGDPVLVYEPESGLEGPGEVTEIDADAQLVYLTVSWSSLRPADVPAPLTPELLAWYRITVRTSTDVAVTTRAGIGTQQQLVTTPPVSSAA